MIFKLLISFAGIIICVFSAELVVAEERTQAIVLLDEPFYAVNLTINEHNQILAIRNSSFTNDDEGIAWRHGLENRFFSEIDILSTKLALTEVQRQKLKLAASSYCQEIFRERKGLHTKINQLLAEKPMPLDVLDVLSVLPGKNGNGAGIALREQTLFASGDSLFVKVFDRVLTEEQGQIFKALNREEMERTVAKSDLLTAHQRQELIKWIPEQNVHVPLWNESIWRQKLAEIDEAKLTTIFSVDAVRAIKSGKGIPSSSPRNAPVNGFGGGRGFARGAGGGGGAAVSNSECR